jgi:hypothetical protein
LTASHTFETRVSNTNKVEFIFENINLPFDNANNDGYITFKIKTKPNLVLGDTFSNTANIYFDYNFPIATNNYLTSVQNPLSVTEHESNTTMIAYPNPVKDALQFETIKPILKAEIYDISGRIIVAMGVTNNTLDVTALQRGNYVVKVFTEDGVSYRKIIKD